MTEDEHWAAGWKVGADFADKVNREAFALAETLHELEQDAFWDAFHDKV